MDNQIVGIYTRKSGSKRSYAYTATVFEAARGFSWNAVVRRDGEIRGTPNGRVLSDTPEHAQYTIRSLVENSIENLLAVAE